jgi:hypothetical protein
MTQQVIDATTLDPQLNPLRLNLAVVTPRRFMNVSPRLEFALNPNNTLSVRYSRELCRPALSRCRRL